MKKTPLLAAFLAINAIATPAMANSGHNEEVVEYGDLDLANTDDQSTFDQRLHRAIRKVCGSKWSRSVREATATRVCIAEKKAELAPLRAELIANAIQQTRRGTLAHNPG